LAENPKQFELIVLIKKNLDLLFANEPNVFVAGDLFWYPVEGDNVYFILQPFFYYSLISNAD
jgi:hypothetical protein